MTQPLIQEMFHQTAARFPDRVAMEGGIHGDLTYAQLVAKANQLANHLIENGAAKGTIVAVFSDDPFHITPAALGIMQAGCVFVPFDPRLPGERLQAMIAEVRPDWVLMEGRPASHLGDGFDDILSTATIRLMDEGDLPAGTESCWVGSDAPAASRSEPDDMCYVYFTSGSTGKPKGIAGRLKAIGHFIDWEIQTLGLDETCRTSQLTSPGFDAFLRDVFVPLCAGGQVVVPPNPETIIDRDRLVAWIDANRITLLHTVPSLFRAILEGESSADHFADLKHVLLAGEQLLPSDVKRWTSLFGDRIPLVNLYGPSETTMTKFAYFVTAADGEKRSVPIGKPIKGAAAILLDEKGRPSPEGTVGEIYIRTPYRSLGYFNRDDLTAEVFIPNPFSDNPEDLIYRTGDFGRLKADGDYEFLGRKDNQVKIRGVRVELEEIERLISGHSPVTESVVIDRLDNEGNRYLCAYVVFSGEPDITALRTFLAQKLPEALVPSTYLPMDSLPRNLVGKIDRAALPAPEKVQAETREIVEPRNDVERTLAEIYCNVLGLPKVSIHDSFFEIGGHSLTAMRIIARIHTTFEVDLMVPQFFDTPSIAGLAEQIETLKWADQEAPDTGEDREEIDI
jgi:amino acid adenylation domain-containing protein